MDELLKKLVESELLNEETRKELEEQLNTALNAKVNEKVEKLEESLKAEYAKRFVKEKEQLAEALDTKVEECLRAELEELKEDIERFRDLEAEYAKKLVEEKEKMAQTLQSDIRNLMEALDAYVEERLVEELNECRDSIEEVLKENYGRKIVESIGNEYRERFLSEADIEEKKLQLEAELTEAREELQNVKKQLDESIRSRKLEEVLESLSGSTRSVMEAILENVPTERLEEAYDRYIGKVLKEATNEESEKEKGVLAEGENSKEDILKEGDSSNVLPTEADSGADAESQEFKEWIQLLRKRAGVTNA